MTTKGEQYRNRYTGEIVTVEAIESVRVGPGETYKDVVVLDDGSRWQEQQFMDCYAEARP